MCPTNLLSEYTNREITTTWYYVNYRRIVDSKEIRIPDGIWTHDPLWSSRILYHWATGDSVVSKGQIVGIDWNCIMRLHSHMLAHMNSLTAPCCHIKASHMNSLTASCCHIKASHMNSLTASCCHIKASHMNSLTAPCCHIKASHMNSLTASRCHIKALHINSLTAPCCHIKASHMNSLTAPCCHIWTH